jgi:hypothetical protein
MLNKPEAACHDVSEHYGVFSATRKSERSPKGERGLATRCAQESMAGAGQGAARMLRDQHAAE